MNRLLVFIVMKQKIHEIFMKKYWELAELENEVFWVGHFELFFLLHLNQELKRNDWRKELLLYYVNLIRACLKVIYQLVYIGEKVCVT